MAHDPQAGERIVVEHSPAGSLAEPCLDGTATWVCRCGETWTGKRLGREWGIHLAQAAHDGTLGYG